MMISYCVVYPRQLFRRYPFTSLRCRYPGQILITLCALTWPSGFANNGSWITAYGPTFDSGPSLATNVHVLFKVLMRGWWR